MTSGLALVLLAASQAGAAPTDPRAKDRAPKADAAPATPAVTTGVKAAAERTIDAKASGASARRTSSRDAGPKRPAMAGPKIPDVLRKQLEKQLEARIDRDLQRIRQLRAEAIALLTMFVAETPREAREMPEALLRLGELEWEAEREQLAARFKAWEAKPVDQRGPAPEPNYQPSRERFGRVLRDYPGFSQLDLALYVDGFLAFEQGKQDEALDRFNRILRDFPGSRFVPDAHMARAEALFNGKSDFAGALAEYAKVLEHPGSDLYGLAMFKSAWCLWRLGRTEEAARRFVGVFELTDDPGARARSSAEPRTAAQRRQLDELQSEALKYLVEVFTEDDKNTAQDVFAFLTKIGGERFAGKVVRALAAQFYDQAHYERGIEAYELLLKLEPASAEAGAWVLAIADGYRSTEDYPRLQAAYQRAVSGYTTGGAWAKAQGDSAVVKRTTEDVERQLRQHALELHARAQKDKTSRAEFEAAAGLYGVHLSRFGADRNAPPVSYYLAEIDFHHLDRPTEAATHYMAAARAIPKDEAEREPQKTLRHDAIYNAIAALERVRSAELETRRKQQAGYQETEADKKFAEALELYAQLYPNDPALPDLFFRQGRQYYDYGVYDAAVKIWGSLLERFPRSANALAAGELILDSFNRAKNYENIETWARRLKSAPAFQADGAQKKLDALIVQAVFKQGEQKASAGEHGEAARAYLRAAREFPRDPRAAQACVNAELAAQRAGDLTLLREAAQLVTGKEYRERPESPQGAWIAAVALQAMGLFAESAELHEAIAQLADRDHPHYQRFEHAKDAAYDAVVLRVATGEHDRAIADGARFLAAYGSSPEADEVVFQMGKAHQSAGRNREAADLYRRFLARSKNQDHRVQGYVLLALAALKTGDDRGVDEALRSAVDIGKHRRADLGPDGKYAAARARYMEGERILARFEQIRVQGEIRQLKARLKQKADLLKQASSVFLDVVSLGVAEWTTAALYQIGRTYEQFAKALREAPPPGELSDADKEAYQQQIDEFVVPIEERSLDAYENGWKKAVELGIYNQWTEKMRTALGRLNAELYPPFKEIGFELRSQGPLPLPALIDTPRRTSSAAAPSAPGPAPAPVAKSVPLAPPGPAAVRPASPAASAPMLPDEDVPSARPPPKPVPKQSGKGGR